MKSNIRPLRFASWLILTATVWSTIAWSSIAFADDDRPESYMRRHAERQPSSYEVDPQLRQLFEDRTDLHIPRDQVIERFEQYIAAHPEGPFVPELYFRIGELYGPLRRKDLGEEPNFQKINEYYEKARDAYGGKYSTLNYNAWASLANAPNATIEQRKAFYDWWLSLAGATVDDIHPYRRVEQTFNGRSAERDLDNQEVVLANLQHHHAQFQKVAEDNILWRVQSHPEELANLAGSYPDTRLGREAARLLNELQSRGAMEAVDRSIMTITELDEMPEGVESAGTPAPATDRAAAASSPEPLRSASEPAEDDAAPSKWFLGAGALVVLMLLALVAYTIQRKRRNTKLGT